MALIQNLGDFGVQHDAHAELEFGYFGQTIRVHPDAGELTYVEFMAKAAVLEDTPQNQTEGLVITMEFLHNQIHPDDWDSFYTLAKHNHQKLEDLMLISRAIVEAVAAFPTGQQSGSAPTSSTTATKSKAGSSRPATTRGKSRAIERGPSVDSMTPEETKAAAYEALTGRPDLMHAVELAYEGQLAS